MFIAYKYGAGYGAIIGFACGVAVATLTGNFRQVAVFCMLGILAGTFRELGRLTVTMVYFIATIIFFGVIVGIGPYTNLIQESYAAVGTNPQKVVFEASLVQGFIPLVAGSVLFLILPDSIVYKIYNSDGIMEEESFLKQNLHILTRDRLEEFSESFHNLAETFHNNSHKKRNMDDIDKEEIFNELSEELCKDCKNCNICWDRYSKETYHGVNELIDIVELDGTILMDQVSLIIGDILEKSIIPSEKNKTVISKKQEMYVFEEGANYILLTGFTKMKKYGSLVSGDNYSFIYPDSGTVVMTLLDGMGTGEAAFKESESVINLLEQFIEAGFSKKSAIKLINSVMLIRSEEQMFSSIDMSVINLYTGMCDFIKLGASTTFIKREDEVEAIQSNDLPVGMINQVDYEVKSRNIEDGDFIIMVTDGVIDSIPANDKEELLVDFIKSIDTNNSKEIANSILNFSLESNNWIPKDDMTVLVGGFWEKPFH